MNQPTNSSLNNPAYSPSQARMIRVWYKGQYLGLVNAVPANAVQASIDLIQCVDRTRVTSVNQINAAQLVFDDSQAQKYAHMT